MDAIAFLRAILPQRGVYYAATPKSFTDKSGKVVPYFAHVAFHDIESLAQHIEMHDAAGTTMYHACSSYKDEFYMEFDAQRGKERKRTRTFKNMRSAKAFWTDLDCGYKLDGTQKDYPDQKTALADLARFCKAAAVPAPLLVSSGYGIHAYWPLTEELTAPSWKAAADLFKKTMIAHGVKLDPSRGADGASVLRTPGSHNYKDPSNPKRVGILRPQAAYDTATFVNLIQRAAKKASVESKALPATKPSYLGESVVDLGTQLPEGDANKIADACAHINDLRSTQGDLPEPMWYAGLGVLAHCTDGNALSHAWSAGHPDYDYDATERKIVQWTAATTGPATCAYFESKGGAGKCASCAFKGKVTTPLQLGLKVKEAPKLDDEGHEIHPPPFPYSRGEDGIYVTIDKIADIKKKVYSADIYLSDIVTHPHGHEIAVVHYNRPLMGWRTLQAQTSTFNKQDTAWKWFSDNGIYIASKESAEVMSMYMRSYLAELHQRKQALSSFTNLGWKDDGSFLAGQAQVMPDGKIKANKVITQTLPITKHMVPVGDLGAWSELTKVFARRDMVLHGYGFLAGASSPFCSTHGLNAAALNMVGQTGTGKSSIQRLINSLYGDPSRLLMTAKDTHNAIIKRVGVFNNIALCIDEIGNIDAKQASNLILQLTQGKDKETLTQNREERHANEWNLTPIFSSNHPLRPKLFDLKSDTAAESARILEINIPVSQYFSNQDAGTHFNETVQKNYGKAGVYLMKKLVATGDRGKSYLVRADALLTEHGLTFLAHERYIRAQMICALACGLFGQEINLFQFDPLPCVQAAYQQHLAQRSEVEKDKNDAIDLISMFTNQHFDKILVVEEGYHNQPIITHDTRGGEIIGRIYVYKNKQGDILNAKLALSVQELRTWTNRKMSSIAEVRRDLTVHRALLDESATLTLGKGTQYSTPPIRCLVINMLHPRLRPALERDGVKAEFIRDLNYGHIDVPASVH